MAYSSFSSAHRFEAQKIRKIVPRILAIFASRASINKLPASGALSLRENPYRKKSIEGRSISSYLFTGNDPAKDNSKHRTKLDF